MKPIRKVSRYENLPRPKVNLLTMRTQVMIFHGQARDKNVKALMDCDVVLTTYAVLESTFRRQHSGFKKAGVIVKEKSPLHEIKWARIVVSSSEFALRMAPADMLHPAR